MTTTSKVTSSDCKTFLVKFLAANPQIIISVFGSENQDMIEPMKNMKNWKRWNKRRTNENDTFNSDGLDFVSVFEPNVKPNFYGEPTGSIKYKDIVWAREFYYINDEVDGGFTVYELKDGSLYLGQYHDTLLDD